MTRRRLPNRRRSEVVAFEFGGFSYTATVSRFGNGDLAEIFLDVAAVGSPVSTIARDLAVTASLALQYGCPPDVLSKALTRAHDGAAAGPLAALLDAIVETKP